MPGPPGLFEALNHPKAKTSPKPIPLKNGTNYSRPYLERSMKWNERIKQGHFLDQLAESCHPPQQTTPARHKSWSSPKCWPRPYQKLLNNRQPWAKDGVKFWVTSWNVLKQGGWLSHHQQGILLTVWINCYYIGPWTRERPWPNLQKTNSRVFGCNEMCCFCWSPKTLPAIWCGSHLPRPRCKGNRPSRRPWCACDTFPAQSGKLRALFHGAKKNDIQYHPIPNKTHFKNSPVQWLLQAIWFLPNSQIIWNGLYRSVYSICCKLAHFNLLHLTLAIPYCCCATCVVCESF